MLLLILLLLFNFTTMKDLTNFSKNTEHITYNLNYQRKISINILKMALFIDIYKNIFNYLCFFKLGITNQLKFSIFVKLFNFS